VVLSHLQRTIGLDRRPLSAGDDRRDVSLDRSTAGRTTGSDVSGITACAGLFARSAVDVTARPDKPRLSSFSQSVLMERAVISKRAFLQVAANAAVAAGGCLCCSAAPRKENEGCLLSREEFERLHPVGAISYKVTGKEPLVLKSGIPELDLAIAQTLVKLVDVFQVHPGFAFYEDGDDPNAYATDNTRLNGADGTVLQGLNDLRNFFKTYQHPDVAIATTLAHEFGHILQYKRGLLKIVNLGRTTKVRSELQADYLAGYFIGLRKRERPSLPAAVAAMSLYDIGSRDVDTRSHGTPKERGQAFERGYDAGFRRVVDLDAVVRESTDYVLSLPLPA
jgi:hypothetical protein